MTTYRQENDGTYAIAFFGNTTIDVCEALESHMSRIFVALYLPDLEEMGNVLEPCPLMVSEWTSSSFIIHSNWIAMIEFVVCRFLTGSNVFARLPIQTEFNVATNFGWQVVIRRRLLFCRVRGNYGFDQGFSGNSTDPMEFSLELCFRWSATLAMSTTNQMSPPK